MAFSFIELFCQAFPLLSCPSFLCAVNKTLVFYFIIISVITGIRVLMLKANGVTRQQRIKLFRSWNKSDLSVVWWTFSECLREFNDGLTIEYWSINFSRNGEGNGESRGLTLLLRVALKNYYLVCFAELQCLTWDLFKWCVPDTSN